MRVERALYRRQRHTHSPASVTTRAWVVVGEQPAASLVVWSFHSYSARRSIVLTPTSSWRPNDRHSTQRISRGGQSRRFSGRYCAHTHSLTHSLSINTISTFRSLHSDDKTSRDHWNSHLSAPATSRRCSADHWYKMWPSYFLFIRF